jgi:guanyl-specific ribonuclease Sa
VTRFSRPGRRGTLRAANEPNWTVMRNGRQWMRSVLLLGVAIAAAAGWLSQESPRHAPLPDGPGVAAGSTQWSAGAEALPPEAHATLRLIAAGGPFPYDRDGSVFQNREGRLPSQPRGYYREYTVETPDSPDRGARRIVTGGEPPTEFFYTDDHYRSFRRLEAATR